MKHSTAQDITYIDYIDTLPGVGKTHWMMDQLEAFIVAHLSGEAKEKGLPHTYIYAAPTHAILHEQSMALAQRFSPPVWSSSECLEDEADANDESLPEEERERARERQRRRLKAQNKYSAETRTRALRLITHWHESKLRMSPVPALAAKELPVKDGKPAWRRGTVLFMTHGAFVNLPYNEDPESDASLRTRCIGVFFDEARQVLDHAVDKGTRLPSALLYQLFKGKPCKSADGSDTRTFRLYLRQNLSPAELRDTLTPFFTVLSDRQRAAVNSLYTTLKNPRYEVYAELPKSVTDEFKALRSGEIQKNGTTKAHPFLRVLLPSHLFDGYHSVLLASAWLSSSQMFHLLKQASVAGDGSCKIKLRNVTAKLHRYVGEYEKIPRYELIRKRLSRVTILPLISNREVTHEMVKDGSIEDGDTHLTPLSKNRLNQMLVTEEGRRRLFQLRGKIPDSEQEIVRAYTRSSPFERYRYYVQFSDGDERLSMPRAVRRIMALENEGHLYSNPLLYMARAALHLARRWDSGGRQDTSDYLNPIEPLMVVNKTYADFIRNSCIFPDAKRRKMEAVDDDLSYSTFGNNVTFMSSYSHGLNCYQDKTCVAFLSAIQPEPSFARLLSMRLGPDYDYQKDYLISTCAQAVARTAMRDAKSRKSVLVMVPDVFTARELSSHFDSYPTVLPPADLEDAEHDLSLSFADVSRILFSNTSPKHLPKDEYLAHKEEHAVYRKQIVKKAVSSYQMRMVDAIGEEGAKRLSYVRTRIWMFNKKFGIFNNDHPKLKAFIEERDSLLAKYKAYKKEHGLSKEEYAVHRKQIVKKAVKSYQDRVASVIGEDGAKRLRSLRVLIPRLTKRLENDSSDKATHVKLKKLTAERDALLAAYKEAKAKAKHTAKEL